MPAIADIVRVAERDTRTGTFNNLPRQSDLTPPQIEVSRADREWATRDAKQAVSIKGLNHRRGHVSYESSQF